MKNERFIVELRVGRVVLPQAGSPDDSRNSTIPSDQPRVRGNDPTYFGKVRLKATHSVSKFLIIRNLETPDHIE